MSRPLAWLSSLNGTVARITVGLCGALLLAITVVVLVSVFFRYVVNSSLVWSEELTRYLAVWLVFLGMAPAYRAGEHVRIGVVVDRLPDRWRRATYVIAELVVIGLVSVVAWEGGHLAAANFERDQLTPALRIPIAWIYVAIPIGLGLMSLQSLERLVRLLFERPLPRPEPELATSDLLQGVS